VSDSLKSVFRELRDAGKTREEMQKFSRECGCMGCIRCHSGPCQCGHRCECRCTLPDAVSARQERRTMYERIIDEVLAESAQRQDENI
jgi:hypothetical protein